MADEGRDQRLRLRGARTGLALTATEYEVLRLLSVDAGRVVMSESPLRGAWKENKSEPVIRLTDRVLRQCPANMSRIFWGLQGSDAHETQVKIIT